MIDKNHPEPENQMDLEQWLNKTKEDEDTMPPKMSDAEQNLIRCVEALLRNIMTNNRNILLSIYGGQDELLHAVLEGTEAQNKLLLSIEQNLVAITNDIKTRR